MKGYDKKYQRVQLQGNGYVNHWYIQVKDTRLYIFVITKLVHRKIIMIVGLNGGTINGFFLLYSIIFKYCFVNYMKFLQIKQETQMNKKKKICEILPSRGNHCEYLSSFLPKLKQLTLYFVQVVHSHSLRNRKYKKVYSEKSPCIDTPGFSVSQLLFLDF